MIRFKKTIADTLLQKKYYKVRSNSRQTCRSARELRETTTLLHTEGELLARRRAALECALLILSRCPSGAGGVAVVGTARRLPIGPSRPDLNTYPLQRPATPLTCRRADSSLQDLDRGASRRSIRRGRSPGSLSAIATFQCRLPREESASGSSRSVLEQCRDSRLMDFFTKCFCY